MHDWWHHQHAILPCLNLPAKEPTRGISSGHRQCVAEISCDKTVEESPNPKLEYLKASLCLNHVGQLHLYNSLASDGTDWELLFPLLYVLLRAPTYGFVCTICNISMKVGVFRRTTMNGCDTPGWLFFTHIVCSLFLPNDILCVQKKSSRPNQTPCGLFHNLITYSNGGLL